MRQRKDNAAGIAARLRASGSLAAEWTEDDARDLLFMLLSLHIYEYLVEQSGWSPTKYGRLLRRLLERALLDPPDPTEGPAEIGAASQERAPAALEGPPSGGD